MTITKIPQFFNICDTTSVRQMGGQGGSSQTELTPSDPRPSGSGSSHPRTTSLPAGTKNFLKHQSLKGMPSLNSNASSSQAPNSEDVGNITENIYAALTKAGQEKYCHYDDDAFVLSSCPGSEDQQKKLIRTTIASADKFAIMATFGIKPRRDDDDPNKISATMFTILEEVSKKQYDKEFSFVLLYNENHLQNNFVTKCVLGPDQISTMSLSSERHKRGTTTWPEVVEAYNRQQSNDDWKIHSLDCNVYFIAAKARGIAGSHHNKFCINDRGLAATLGASIANKTKDNWYDSGCITLSQTLASKQRDYFVDELVGNHDGKYGQLKMQDGIPTVEKLEDASKIKSLKDIPVKNPMDESSDGEPPSGLGALKQTLTDCGLSPNGAKKKVLWLQSPSHSHKNRLSTGGKIDVTAIGYALCHLFDSAEAGDTINIINKYIGRDGFDLIANALAKGCNVNIVITAKYKTSLEKMAEQFFSQQKSNKTGKLTIKPFSPNEEFSNAQKFNNQKPPVIHGKTYVFVKPNGARVIMTGTYNLNGQSYFRSGENMMLTTAFDDELSKTLFDDIYNGSSSDIIRYPITASSTHKHPYLPMFPC